MIYVTGDIHGDATRFSDKAFKKLKKRDTLLICGDFGCIWQGSAAEQKFLKKLGKSKCTIAFLDGTHENFDLLAAYPVTEWQGGRVQVVSGNLIHLLRGETYTIEGKRFFVFGGGESPAYDLRSEAGNYWEAEVPTAQDVDNANHHLSLWQNTVDYIITHAPSAKAGGFLSADTPVGGVNLLLNRFEETVQYTRWYFGCLHLDKTISPRHRAVFRDIVPIEELWAVRKGKHFKK